MKVLITGGTGFVGSHTVASVLAAGHEVRLLLRRPEQAALSLAPFEIPPPPDIVVGDVTDAGIVREAVAGCDAVIHGASVYSLDPRKAKLIGRTNIAGTRAVIEEALATGADPVVHISSSVALLPAGPGGLSHDSPPGRGVGAYSRSKAESERLARGFQDRGKPVVTVMPGSVWGPHDPYLGESSKIARDYLKGRMRTFSKEGGFPIVDVRDVATGIAATLEPGRGPRRYLMAGTFVSTVELARLLTEITGTRRRFVTVPGPMLGVSAVAFDAIARLVPFPITGEMVRIGTQPPMAVDDSRAMAELGFHPRPLIETLTDTVASLAATGRLGKEAGVLAPPP